MSAITEFLRVVHGIGRSRAEDSVMIRWRLNCCLNLRYVGLLWITVSLPVLSDQSAPDAFIKGFSELPLSMVETGPMIAFGGATELSAVPWLKARGYATILNLRSEQERPGHLKLMMEQAKAYEIGYIHLAFDPTASIDIVPQFIDVVRASSNHPLYVHCNSATRAAALWLIYRVLEDDLDFEVAKREAEAIAGRPKAAIDFARRYLRQRE